jgi:TolA-binding protein
MKKLFLIIATSLMVTSVWAQSQQLITVKGKTKDGKSINMQYYKGAAQDYIESVKYQLVDELQAENKNKQNSINDLQYQLNKANRRIDNLNEQLKNSDNAEQITILNTHLDEKQGEIDQLNEQLEQLNKQLSNLQKENAKLQRQVDSIKAVNQQLSQKKSRLAKSPVIGVEAGIGTVLLTNNNSNNPWQRTLSWNKQVAIYYGTDRLTEGFPLSIEAGLGFRNLPMKATLSNYTATGSYYDCDGDLYQPIYDNCSERLTVNYLEIPVRICIGQPVSNKVSIYTKLGVTPSFILSSNLTNVYLKKGYYSDWNVTFENIDELGLGNEECNEKMTSSRRFNLWGNAAFGAYFPLGSSVLFNLGAKVDYSLLKTGTFTNRQEGNTSGSNTSLLFPDGFPTGLEGYDGRLLIPSLQAGFIYSLK